MVSQTALGEATSEERAAWQPAGAGFSARFPGLCSVFVPRARNPAPRYRRARFGQGCAHRSARRPLLPGWGPGAGRAASSSAARRQLGLCGSRRSRPCHSHLQRRAHAAATRPDAAAPTSRARAHTHTHTHAHTRTHFILLEFLEYLA